MKTSDDLIRTFYDELNRQPCPDVADLLDPDILRVEFEGTPNAGTFRGREAVVTHIHQGRSTWAEGGCHPEQLFTRGEHVVVYVHVHVRLNGATAWLEGRIADGFVVRDGRIAEFRSFAQRGDAMMWAGMPDVER